MNDEERLEQICLLLNKAHQPYLKTKDIKAVGYQFIYYPTLYGELSLYKFKDNNIIEHTIPVNENGNRPGIKQTKTLYVCVHDTASAAETADAYAHARYFANGGGGTSCHYSCGDDAIYHQMPNDEIAYHAGDGTVVKEQWTNSGVKASTKKPVIDIKDNYFYFNGEKSLIECPKLEVRMKDNALSYYSEGAFQAGKVIDPEGIVDIEYNSLMINTEGLATKIGEDGNYYLGPVYYNRTYGFIANRLGNLNSIGIETMINKGSNILRTWHNCAKLVASLLIENNLDLNCVKPHHFFSGKPCPQTMRINDEWHHFMEMVEIEYEMKKLLGCDGSISFECSDTEDGIFDSLINKDHIDYQVTIKINNLVKKLSFRTIC